VGWFGGQICGFAGGLMAGKLTVVKVRALIKPGRYGDGKGLWLQVRDAEHRSWLFRFMLNGKAPDGARRRRGCHFGRSP
jgi:hypothetical protein